MEKKASRILVPVDFSEQSKEGIYQAIRIAQETGATIFLLHVIRNHLPPWSFMNIKERETQTVSIEQALTNEARQLTKGDTPELKAVVAEGKLCDTILNEAVRLEVQLIVIGTSTADNIKKKIIGSNALRIVTEAEIPVLTVKKGCSSPKIDHIILPLDLNKETREKVSNAIKMAKQFNSKIFAVSFSSTRDDGVVGYLKGQLQQVESFVKKSGIEIKTDFRFYEKGKRKEKFIDYIQEAEGDLVMLTTHQQPEIVSFFIGSFAKEIIHGAPIPVFSIIPRGTFKILTRLPGTD